jgi:hypothetical protein
MGIYEQMEYIYAGYLLFQAYGALIAIHVFFSNGGKVLSLH